MHRYRQLLHTLLILTLTASVTAAAEKEMSVQVREGQVRDKPSFLGRVTATLNYGDRVTVTENRGPWTKVGLGSTEGAGWIHDTALTKKRIKLKAGEDDADVAASSGELALAGKGFNSDVEAQFKSRNKDVDYTWVDKMEKMVVPVEDCQAFLKAGNVESTAGGGQ